MRLCNATQRIAFRVNMLSAYTTCLIAVRFLTSLAHLAFYFMMTTLLCEFSYIKYNFTGLIIFMDYMFIRPDVTGPVPLLLNPSRPLQSHGTTNLYMYTGFCLFRSMESTADELLGAWNQRCNLETLVLVSRRLEDMKNGLGLGLGLDEKVSTFSRP